MSAITPVVKVGDLGTAFDITVKQPTNPADPSGAKTAIDFSHADYVGATYQFEFEKPNGKRLALVTATKKDATNGILTYTTATNVASIFDANRRWKIRPIITKSNSNGGSSFRGTWVGFTVGD
jgi:hypothetical protein|tara:strand:- start:16143 stop:16511 length:369 start_codon:yes stop_codon:yes gene_type:complete